MLWHCGLPSFDSQNETYHLLNLQEIFQRVKSRPPCLLHDADDHYQRQRLSSAGDFDIVLTNTPLDALSVDTMWVSLPISAVEIRPDHQLRLTPAGGGAKKRVLWQYPNGERVEGISAYWNSSLTNEPVAQVLGLPIHGVNVNIRPLRRANAGKRGWIGRDSIGCLIRFSIEGIVGQGNNAWPVPGMLLSRIVDLVQQLLKCVGIVTDLRHGTLCRCDLNRNFVVEEPWQNYMAVLGALYMPYMKQWKRAPDQKPNEYTMYYSNKSHCVLLYDKITQLSKNNQEARFLPRRLTRLGWQLRRAKNVQQKLGVTTVQDLINRWETLPDGFATGCYNALFSHNITTMRAPSTTGNNHSVSTVSAEIENLLRWCNRKHLPCDLTLSDLSHLVRTQGMDCYKSIITAIPGMDQKHAATAVRRMRAAYWEEQVTTVPDFRNRYHELKLKAAGGRCWPALPQRQQDLT
ncbi:MAG: hypothetical protein JOZ57_06575 [Abitibacteriaceae bacterium]|nr:hypothetical protein [Abditibacteriaceae bacterium]